MVIQQSNQIVLEDLFRKPTSVLSTRTTRSLYFARKELLALPNSDHTQHPDIYSHIFDHHISHYLNANGKKMLTMPLDFGDSFNNTLISRALFNEKYLLGVKLLEHTDSNNIKLLLDTVDSKQNTILHTMLLFNSILNLTSSNKYQFQLNRLASMATPEHCQYRNEYGLTPVELSAIGNGPLSSFTLSRKDSEIMADVQTMMQDCGIFEERLIIDYKPEDPFYLVAYSCLNCFSNDKMQKRLKEIGEASLELLNEKERKTYAATYSFRSLPKLRKCIEFARHYIKANPNPIDVQIVPLLNRLSSGTPLIEIMHKNLKNIQEIDKLERYMSSSINIEPHIKD